MADAILCASGIYAIRNILDGKCYVGSAVNVKCRWGLHRRQLRNGAHHSIKLQRAWEKYGSDAFVFEVVEVVAEKANLLVREQFWMGCLNAVKAGYNVAPIAGSALGMKRRPESIEKNRLAKLGNTYCVGIKHTNEARANMAASHRGKRQSAETKAKRSASLKGIIRSPEWRANMAAASKNPSAETRAKLAAAARARVYSIEERKRMSERRTGVKIGPLSEEHKEKISDARKAQGNFRDGFKLSEETKAKISLKIKESWARKREAAGLTVLHDIQVRRA